MQLQVSSAPAARRVAVAEVDFAVGASLAASFVPHQARHLADDARQLQEPQAVVVEVVVVDEEIVAYFYYAVSHPDVDCDTLGQGQPWVLPSVLPSGTAGRQTILQGPVWQKASLVCHLCRPLI